MKQDSRSPIPQCSHDGPVFLPGLLARLPGALVFDDAYEQVLMRYREMQRLDVILNRVLDTVKDGASADLAAPVLHALHALHAQMEEMHREIGQIPEAADPPAHKELRFELMLHDDYNSLTIYLIDRNLRRIKKLGIRSEAFDREIRALHPQWPRMRNDPIDLDENLAAAADLRRLARTRAAGAGLS